MDNVRASMAMASYNGEKYINQQIDSILELMGSHDELVISDDGSTDSTWDILKDYSSQDPRIRILANQGKHGVSDNFTNAALECRGTYIFLSDQDDIWVNDIINRTVTCFESSHPDMVIHDGLFVDNTLKPIMNETIFQYSKISTNPWRNLIKCTYWGCCMAMTRDISRRVFPIPDTQLMDHDVWAGIYTGVFGRIELLREIGIWHRLHDSNLTPVHRRSLKTIVTNRLALLRGLAISKNPALGLVQ